MAQAMNGEKQVLNRSSCVSKIQFRNELAVFLGNEYGYPESWDIPCLTINLPYGTVSRPTSPCNVQLLTQISLN